MKQCNAKICRNTLYRMSSGCTAIAVSPNIVSGLAVPTMILSSVHGELVNCRDGTGTNGITGILDLIGEGSDHAKLKSLSKGITRDGQHRTTAELFCFHLTYTI